MLVLARRAGESIEIGDNVIVTVLRVGRGTVRLGITAPREMQIRRPGETGPKLKKPAWQP